MPFAILYYLVLVPLSVMPHPLVKAISSVFYYVLYYLASYRKTIVMQNLRKAFPEKSEQERVVICRRFYRHLCDTFFEGLMCLHMSERRLMRHIRCKNPELINAYYNQGRSVIIAIGHYGSWEFFLTGLNALIHHQVVIIYTPLTTPLMERKLTEARESFGTRMISKDAVKLFFEEVPSKATATLFAIDQWPAKAKKPYWMTFLNQETAVAFGCEKYARDSGQAVLYARISKEKRGHYSIEFSPVCDEPQKTKYGEITEKVTRLLEEDILRQPEYWLWSHRRWKQSRAEFESADQKK
ncbi:MAG TPA: lysophospholipid acyltransferase family protein [Bacteroidia bacterium]|nr:lysophospholipid acyltransferase family protein [Bacteroidia bacterium]